MEPLVSIIIPSYNRANLIGETLDSIIQQSYFNWECLVIDDGSTDGSEAVIDAYCEKDQRIQFYYRPSSRPKGANACRNFGFELSEGEYVNWIDSDDLMQPNKLKLQIEALDASSKPFCVCQSYIFEGTIENILGLRSKQILTETPFSDFFKKQLIIPIQAPVFKKKFLIDNHLNFDEELQAGQEWELFVRILLVSEDYLTINKPLDYIRRHSDSISGLNISASQLWWYFFARYKIYKQFKTKLSSEDLIYLKRYFLLIYKSFLRQNEINKAFQVWRMAILSDNIYSIKQHLLLVLSLLSFLIFKKGDIFLSKVNRWNI